MPQLDSLRALAALGVFAQHFLPHNSFFASTLPLGDLGVRMFFVLSGFLITSILLVTRKTTDDGSLSKATAIGRFYVRRAIRLMPVYFIFLTLTFLFVPEVREYAIWFYTYLQNVHYALHGTFTVDGHIWTLAVEEQFYLIWPLVILFLPRPALLPVVVLVILLGVASRIAFIGMGMTHFAASMLTPSHFDTLGLGALLAIARWTWPRRERALRTWLHVGCILGLALLAIVLWGKVSGMPSTVEFIFGGVGASLLFVWVVGMAANGFRGAMGVVLDNATLRYIGTVSYGMYVYHMFVPRIADQVGKATGLQLPDSAWLRLVVFSVAAIGIAVASWHLMERPVSRLKEMFSLQTGRSGRSSRSSSGFLARMQGVGGARQNRRSHHEQGGEEAGQAATNVEGVMSPQ